MTNEEKAVGIGLHVRDLCLSKGVTKDNAETTSLLVQQSAMQMATWKDEQFAAEKKVSIEKAYDTYCKVCGHFAHTVPTHICRLGCSYYTDFRKAMEE